jgi:hypothetical protein
VRIELTGAARAAPVQQLRHAIARSGVQEAENPQQQNDRKRDADQPQQ